MKKKQPKLTLQSKILLLILSLMVFIILLLSASFTYIEWHQVEEQMGNRALQVSRIFSMMPAVREGFKRKDPSSVIQPLAEKVRHEVDAEFIVVGNKEGIRYAHPNEKQIGEKMVGGDNDRALISGKSYISKAVGTLGPSLRGKSPILSDSGEIIGVVSVGYLINDVKYQIFKKILKITVFSLLSLALASLGGVLLSRNIRKDTLGLEPHEIASLYRERSAVLHSIKEGIISIDHEGAITMINSAAMNFFGETGDFIGRKIEEFLPQTKMYDVLKNGETQTDQELQIGKRRVIVNRTPIFEKNKVIGVVSSFRDKTEIWEMVNTLSEVRKYSEDLRAQTHEYTNKLYVISGLLQLGHYKEAIKMIQRETELNNNQNRILFDQVQDLRVQAILLGKIGKASEKKVVFTIDENTSLNPLPAHIDISQLTTILGNVIDNAIEGAMSTPQPEVVFFALDMGNDLVFEIADNGMGIPEQNFGRIFEQGFSTKGSGDRGYGLSNVKEMVENLNGVIEVKNGEEAGAIFTIYIPKTKG
ncbi:sensor histidine kinase [Metabacillus sp. GX 13764]|uniref:ATP-binding protein n=1 Tax=Metabacillus kandeliae TaxID=2900151 RepID=UPI001E5C6A7C|nr:sensor histidine kinase [Metabacillus kandeliae]MCD7034285.1 sensor histidine kinase [Metabacillus kandeliae]